ncbi:MAG: LON peptidase substrate-binding domain-containing protein [Chitinophagaceae bacterium]|nr:LON peptidase substrate-binding domain-containing protein [Chitinophagaceae bacterium]
MEIVVYPGENLNLHIFEPRYKQLIKDCKASNKPFGIPAVVEGKLMEMGTLVELTEISQEYEDGKMDVKTKGIKVFRILEIVKEIPDKLYSGSIVNYPANIDTSSQAIMQHVVTAMHTLHKILNIKKDFKKSDQELRSYDMAHHIGLSLLEEYELLELMHELQRQEYLKRHIKRILSVMTEVENLKARVQLNGHFKNLNGFDL